MKSKSGFTPLFTQSDIKSWVNSFQEHADAALYTQLQQAGEMFVTYARDSGRYFDHTGNLRSSIGYVIVRNGSIVFGDFQKQNIGTEGEEGVQKAKKLARDLADTYNTGLVLIGVAGMEYAAHVEAMESKDVITAASIKAEDGLKRDLQRALERVRANE